MKVNNWSPATHPNYYAQDHLGSVRDLVDASGNGLASYDYDPCGQPTRSTTNGSARADYRYAGLFYHQPSGLYLTHYRVYDPVTARWLSRDPIGERGGVNLYTYTSANPVNFIDKRGLDTTVITVSNFGISVHSAVHVDNGGDGQPVLYDPAGSYVPNSGEPRGSGDIFSVILPTNNGHAAKRFVVPQTLPG
ncbi:MAG: RHS repeat-associated core domain-containing protein [Porticoccaceae bacterium]